MSRPQTKPLPAAIYARISSDPKGEGLGVDRQEQDCRALAERLGWEVVAVHVDNDISAYSGKARPGYRAMLDAVRAGHVRGVLAWHPDRLYRRAVDLEEFVSIAEAHDLQVHTATSGDIDLSTPTGRMNARIVGAVAQHEVERTKERIRAQKRHAAAAGKYRGGPRPFGYEADGLTVREDEARVVRDATSMVIAGRTLGAIARDLDEGPIPPTGTRKQGEPRWDYQSVRDLVLRPRNAGLINSGRPGREGFAVLGPAAWPAIVPEDQWSAAYAILTDSSRRQQDGTAMRWLGTNIYRCGRCAAPMRVAPSSQTKRHHYRCTEQAHLSIAVAETDRFVRAAAVELLRDPAVVAAMTEPDPRLDEYRAERENLTSRLARFEQALYAEDLTPPEYRRLKDRAEADLAEVQGRIDASVQHSQSSPVLSSLDPGQAFLDAPIDVQRAVLRTVLAVTVMPAAAKGAHWSSDRLVLARP